MNRLVSRFTGVLLLLAVAIVFTTCIKEYSYEGGAPNLAIYNFAGTGGTCTNNVVTGSYYAGTPLGAANVIQLQVNVIAAGRYSVNTNTVNGVFFAGSGNFTDTGRQTITVTGSGTPASDGSFSFNSAVDSGCSFIVVFNKAQVISAHYTLAGAPNACTNIIATGNYFYGQALTQSNSIEVNVNVTAAGPYSLTTDTLDGISFSASGTFSGTGIKQITLTGYGTPTFPENLTFNLSGDSTACTFPLPVTVPTPLATYVLESGFGTPSPCIVYALNGNYISGTPLTDSNTVAIYADVITAGNFAVATDTVSGMVFSYAGTFTATGRQTIILKGSGTPVATGTFALTPQIIGPHPLGGQSCGITVPVK